MALAQTGTESKSIIVGPFEFPIAGTYVYSKSAQATVIAVVGSDRTYTVGTFRSTSGRDDVARMAEVATASRRNWERFALEEKGSVVREFRRADLAPNLAVLSMATEFGTGASRQYYVQFAATTGGETAIILVEGSGSAISVMSELEPRVAQVRRVRE